MAWCTLVAITKVGQRINERNGNWFVSSKKRGAGEGDSRWADVGGWFQKESLGGELEMCGEPRQPWRGRSESGTYSYVQVATSFPFPPQPHRPSTTFGSLSTFPRPFSLRTSFMAGKKRGSTHGSRTKPVSSAGSGRSNTSPRPADMDSE